MIKIADIYISIARSLLQLIYIRCGRENIQYSMLDHPEYYNISIDSYNQENYHTFMLALCVVVTRSLTLVCMEVIANIKCYFSQGKMFY